MTNIKYCKKEERILLQYNYDKWKNTDNSKDKFTWLGHVQNNYPPLLRFRGLSKDVWQSVNAMIK